MHEQMLKAYQGAPAEHKGAWLRPTTSAAGCFRDMRCSPTDQGQTACHLVNHRAKQTTKHVTTIKHVTKNWWSAVQLSAVADIQTAAFTHPNNTSTVHKLSQQKPKHRAHTAALQRALDARYATASKLKRDNTTRQKQQQPSATFCPLNTTCRCSTHSTHAPHSMPIAVQGSASPHPVLGAPDLTVA